MPGSRRCWCSATCSRSTTTSARAGVAHQTCAGYDRLLGDDTVLITPTANAESWDPEGPLPTTVCGRHRPGYLREHDRVQRDGPPGRERADRARQRGCALRAADRRVPLGAMACASRSAKGDQGRSPAGVVWPRATSRSRCPDPSWCVTCASRHTLGLPAQRGDRHGSRQVRARRPRDGWISEPPISMQPALDSACSLGGTSRRGPARGGGLQRRDRCATV